MVAPLGKVLVVNIVPLSALAWQRLGDYLRETQLLGSIQNTLYWDQNTGMPSCGAAWRGEQLSYLARQLHARQTSQQFEALLKEARVELENICRTGDLNQTQITQRLRNLDLLEQDLTRQQRLDPALVGALATAKSNGYQRWQQSKTDVDFSGFAPALENLISLRQEQANQLAETRSCWETLAQPFEPDLSLVRLQELFAPLRKRLPELLDKFRASSFQPSNALRWDLTEENQQTLCNRLLQDWGRNVNITSLARSPHPFSITLGPRDFRLTTRVVANKPFSCFLATAHEWGHSLYEQGLPTQSHQWFAWPLGQATSMAVHESQSLFWENRIARSFEFSQRWWPRFASAGAPISSSKDLWKELNPLLPGTNRVEADELSYGLHILIRTDLEIALLEEGLPVNDLPEQWNRRYQDWLGVLPSHDGEGCLQDVHWSEGLFGYFPSYLLGHLISSQLTEAMENAIGPLSEHVSAGQEDQLLVWLREHVHPIGRLMNAEQLVENVTGKQLTSTPFLDYIEAKLDLLLDI